MVEQYTIKTTLVLSSAELAARNQRDALLLWIEDHQSIDKLYHLLIKYNVVSILCFHGEL